MPHAWRRARAAVALTLALACLAAGVDGATADEGSVQRIVFRRAVLNLECSVFELKDAPRPGLQVPEPAGLHFGRIMRRLPGEDVHTSDHYVDFAAEFRGGIAVRAWCDRNFNRDLTDDPPVHLSAHPRSVTSRSFLVDLEWTTRHGWREYSVAQKVRIVLELSEPSAHPQARVQQVYGMLGSVRIGGQERAVVLFDGSGDGLYGSEFGDGLFIDSDADGHFEIDPMAPDFLPASVPVPAAGRTLRVRSVDPEGRWLELVDTGAAAPVPGARVGDRAPVFDALDTTGQPIRLADHRGDWVVLYFWASWCGTCAAQAPGLHEIRKKHPTVRILGVSYDTDRAAMEEFRSRYGESWPTTFSGRMLWEDPIGRLYRVDGPGVLCLINPDGVLEGIHENPADALARLNGLPVGVAGRWRSAATPKGGSR